MTPVIPPSGAPLRSRYRLLPVAELVQPRRGGSAYAPPGMVTSRSVPAAGPVVALLAAGSLHDAVAAGGEVAPADARGAPIRHRAGVAVVARAAFGLGGVRAGPGRRIAGVRVVTLVRCRADDGVRARACAALARVGLRARVAVVAGAAVELLRV